MKKLINKAINPLLFFISDSRSTGILLLFCTAVSLFISNTIDGEFYRSFWNSGIHYSYGVNLPHSGLKWINDFLMAIFFCLPEWKLNVNCLMVNFQDLKKQFCHLERL